MHNRKLIIFPILFSILVLIGSSCSAPKTEWNKEGKYHSLNFPNMEWGMSPEEALNAWGLTFSDVTMLPRGDSYYDVIVLNVQKEVEVFERPAALSFYFGYFKDDNGRTKTPFGLISVQSWFHYEDLDSVLQTCRSLYGESFSPGILNYSQGLISNLPDAALQQKVQNFYKKVIGYEMTPSQDPLTVVELKQETEAPYQVRLTYGGIIAAVVHYLEQNENPFTEYSNAVQE